MPASRKAKRKEAARESSGRDPSSLSLSLGGNDDKGETKERSAKKYHTQCQIEKDVVYAAAKRAPEAKAKNGGRMPDTWYTKYVAEMRQTLAGCHMVITAEDIRNKVRALEKAAAADSILVSRVTRRVAQVPPSGGSSILTEDSVEPQPHAASTTASIVSQVSAQIEEWMQCSYGVLCIFPMFALQTCQRCNNGFVHRLCIPQMMENRMWCVECCRSEEEGDANADSDNLDLLTWESATATLNYDNDECVGSDLPTEVVPPPDTDFHTSSDDHYPTQQQQGDRGPAHAAPPSSSFFIPPQTHLFNSFGSEKRITAKCVECVDNGSTAACGVIIHDILAALGDPCHTPPFSQRLLSGYLPMSMGYRNCYKRCRVLLGYTIVWSMASRAFNIGEREDEEAVDSGEFVSFRTFYYK
jgi:hypothetical protein